MRKASKPAIVGVSDIVPHKGEKVENYWGLAAEASLQALEDAGLTTKDVDGVVFARSGYAIPYLTFTTNFCQYMGITPAWMETAPHGGAQTASLIWRAALGIISGMASTVLLVNTDNRESRLSRSGLVNKIAAQNCDNEYEYPYGPLFPSNFAMMAQRHMHEFGTTSEQIAAVAVNARKWAALHPKARMKEPLTVQDVLNSRMISSPLHLLDICIVTDGGGAAVMVAGDRAGDFPKPPVHVLGFSDVGESQTITCFRDYARSRFLRRATEIALRMADITLDDLDVIYPYDPSTFHVIWALEQMGFCKPGEGGPFVAAGHLNPGGKLPTLTHGGIMAYAHPGMPGSFLAIVEAVRQLRGECGPRQVPGARLALTHAMGGFMTMGINILGRL